MKASSTKTYSWLICLLATLGIIIVIVATFLVYNRISNDQAPDSIAGLAYGVAGTFFLGLATLGYIIVRRSHKRRLGTLNRALHWHISFGIITLLLLFLHSFGNFNPRSGTYALCGMVFLVISGVIGRGLDRLVPKLIAREASNALTEQGEDRIELITQKLEDITTHHREQVEGFEARAEVLIAEKNRETIMIHSAGQNTITLPTSWDLAYISLSENPQEIERDAENYRVSLDRESLLHEPEELINDLQKQMTELRTVQRALQREKFYRGIIRYWRFFHICLAALTISLTLWHLEMAATLLIPNFLHP